MEVLRARLTGTAPLLMHNPATMGGDKGTGLGRKTIPTPQDEAAASRYLLPDGNFYIPAVAVRQSMLEGAIGYRIGKTRAAGVLAAAVTMRDELFPLLNGDGSPKAGDQYVIDSRRAKVGTAGVVRSRAKIELPWVVDCAFSFNSKLASLQHVKEALTNAGMTKGLLDYRPGTGGWFGTFEVQDIWVEES